MVLSLFCVSVYTQLRLWVTCNARVSYFFSQTCHCGLQILNRLVMRPELVILIVIRPAVKNVWWPLMIVCVYFISVVLLYFNEDILKLPVVDLDVMTCFHFWYRCSIIVR